MKLHPRYDIVQTASREIAAAILDAIRKHQLTYGEITQILSGELAQWAKYQIREERHPEDPEIPGDCE